MSMWLRVAGALAVTLTALGCLDYWGLNPLVGNQVDDLQEAIRGRARELFWFAVWALVMATSVLAALRRWAPTLRRAAAPRSARDQG
jgi:hypothetical protein